MNHTVYYVDSSVIRGVGASCWEARQRLSDTPGDIGADMEQYLRPSQAAEILHVSPQTVRRWAAEGKLRHVVTAGGHRRFPRAEVQRLGERLHREADIGLVASEPHR
jgi:excisionase family DNA binding protein